MEHYRTNLNIDRNPYTVFREFSAFLVGKGFTTIEIQLLRCLIQDIVNRNHGYRDEIFKMLFKLLT